MTPERRIRCKTTLGIGEVIELDDFDKWVVVAIDSDPDALWRLVDSEGIREFAPESVIATLRAIR